MSYQVWTHAEFEGWQRKDCDDIDAVREEVLKALKEGKEPLVTVEVPFEVSIKIKEEKIGEVAKSKTKPGEGPRAKGKGEVRPGGNEPVPELSEGSGDNSSDNRVPGQ